MSLIAARAFIPPDRLVRLPLVARRLLFSLSSFIAAMLALLVAFSLDLPRPWWALMTVYVTTQPLAGTLRPRMAYRLAGTVLGAVVAVLLVPPLVNAPLLLSVALAAWIGLCLYLAVLDRTPRAFLFMLAGYTAAIIGFPYTDEPEAIFQIALARLEEASLGIICATVVHTVLLPWDVTRVLDDRVSRFLRDAGTWIADALRGAHGFHETQGRRRVAADVTELGILSLHLPSDGSSPGATRSFVLALQDRLSILLPLASAVEDRLDELRSRNAVPAPVASLVEDVAVWLSRDCTRFTADALQARCRALAPDRAAAPGATWDRLILASLCQRLFEFLEAFADSRALAAQLLAPRREIPMRLRRLLLRRTRRRLHADHMLAALSGLASATALLAHCLLWITTAWPAGSATATFAAIVSCSFAAQDDPTPGIVRYLLYTVAAIPISAVTLFVILPAIDGMPMLVLALAPALLGMGYLQADPARSARALPMLACFIVAMGFTSRYNANFATFLNVSLAQIGGIVVTIGTTRLFRSVGAAWSARRILQRGWRDLASLAAAGRNADPTAWTNRMLDRLLLVTPRLAMAEPGTRLAAADVLNDLRIGRNVIHLRRARAVSGRVPGIQEPVDAVLDGIVRLFSRRAARGLPEAPPAALLHAIDRALHALQAAPSSERRRQGLLALAGMRRNLFPRAPSYASAGERVA